MSCTINDFNGWIEASDLEKIEKMNLDLTHPLNYLLSEVHDSSGCFGATQANTFTSIKAIQRINKTWMASKKKALFNGIDNASGVLGEIRCYSSLLSVFPEDNVHALLPKKSTPTTDFSVTNGNQTIYIEVNTPQLNNDVAKELAEFYNNKDRESETGTNIREISYAPFGSKGTTTKGVITRICGIKEKSKQFVRDSPNVLWIDFQDEYTNGIYKRAKNSNPLFTGIGTSGSVSGIYSNEIWYALYGRKGMKIFDGQTLSYGEGNPVKLTGLEHDGKFIGQNRKKSKLIDAVIISTPLDIIYLENPYKHKKVPIWFLDKISTMSRFNYQSSRGTYFSKCFRLQLLLDRKQVNRMAKKNYYSW